MIYFSESEVVYKIKGKQRFVIKTISNVSHIYYLCNFLEVE